MSEYSINTRLLIDILGALGGTFVGENEGSDGISNLGGIALLSGKTKVVRPAIAVQATPDYSDGDSAGPLITLTDFAREAAGSGTIYHFRLRSLINITVQTFVHLFDANPSVSTFTDNAAMVLHEDDRPKLLHTFTIPAASWVTPKGVSPFYTAPLVGGLAELATLGYKLPAGRNMYMATEADGTINFSSTADLSAIITHIQD